VFSIDVVLMLVVLVVLVVAILLPLFRLPLTGWVNESPAALRVL
jgi:hypothetical protein